MGEGKLRIYRDQGIVTVEIVDTGIGVKAHVQIPGPEFLRLIAKLVEEWENDVHQP